MDWKIIVSEVMQYKKINQGELAKRVEASDTYISHLKNGKRDSPSFDIGLAIVKLHPRKRELLK
jgi:hypothetical protein